MNRHQAERHWQSLALQAMKANMAGTVYSIERRPHTRTTYSYCVSLYVCRPKTAEFWPRYRGGVSIGANLKPFGEEFLATETQDGTPLTRTGGPM